MQGRRAEAALVIGVGSDAVRGEDRAGPAEGVRIVVEAVEREHDRVGLPIREPGAQRQHRAVGGDDAVVLKRRQDRRRRARQRHVGGVSAGEAL
jgi:hypothetical protein